MKKYTSNKKGASMMEYFIITVVVLLVGAAVFAMARSVRDGVESGTGIVEDINGSLKKQ